MWWKWLWLRSRKNSTTDLEVVGDLGLGEEGWLREENDALTRLEQMGWGG